MPLRTMSVPSGRVSDAPGAEQLVQHDRPPDEEVQRVLGGEADAGQHLLAVAGRAPGGPARRTPWPWRPSRGRGRPRRRRGGRRRPPGRRGFRPAGGARPGRCAMGRPNWMRSSACTRASSSIARAAADELGAEGELPQGHVRRPSRPARWSRLGRSNAPVTSNRPSDGIEAVHRPALQRLGCDGERRDPVGGLGHHERRVGTPECVGAQPLHHAPVPVETSRWVASPRAAGRTTAVPPSRPPSAVASSQSSAPEVACVAPSIRRGRRRRWRGRRSSASRQPRSSSAASSAAPLRALGGVPDAALEERALGRLHQRSAPRSRRRRAMMLRWISALPP